MPLRKWKADPPTAPMPKAPPTSSSIRSGHGSREVSGVPIVVFSFRGFGGFLRDCEKFIEGVQALFILGSAVPLVLGKGQSGEKNVEFFFFFLTFYYFYSNLNT